MIYYGNMPIITKSVHEDQTLTAMKKYESFIDPQVWDKYTFVLLK